MPEMIIGEPLDKWMTRCVPKMIEEGKSHDQSIAACTSMHEEFQKITYPEQKSNSDGEQKELNNPVININIGKFKNETRQIKNVEILRPGKYKGVEYNEKELDEFIINFNNGVVEPVLTLDHDEDLTNKTSKELKVAALGYVETLKKVGNKLYADFKQVPRLIADLIERGMFKQRSIEFYKTFKTGDGKSLKNVLTGVTFFGKGLPVVTGMSDLMQFFKIDNKPDGLINKQCDEEKESIFFKEESVMENITISKKEYDELLKIKAMYEEEMKKADKVKYKLSETEAEAEKFKNENAQYKIKLLDTEKQLEEFEKFKSDQLKNEAETFINKIIDDKKLLPKFKDFKVQEYIKLKTDEKTLQIFKEELEQRAVVIPENYKDENIVNNNKQEFKTTEEVEAEFNRLKAMGKSDKEIFKILDIPTGGENDDSN